MSVESAIHSDPLWYKDAVFYEIYVRGFYDSNADGIGDFRGLTEKLDYLKWLGVDCLWLLPMCASPLRDGGYDISDYYSILPEYGTVDDFKNFLDAAHERGMRVIIDLVLNHTSDEHPWFRESRSSVNSPKRDWYVWSETDLKYTGARIIFVDTERSNWAWDEQSGQFYWHRFFSYQPDLNYDNPEVQQAILDVISFWLDMGVDGFRLDAVPYLYEREGTNCENLPETHAFIKLLRRFVDERYPGRLLLAEANQWPEDVVAYFGQGDECHMCYHFPIMPRLFMALRQEDRRRLAPLMDNGRRRIELLNALLFSLPGSPFLYYGDEIGMGDNIYMGDRDGVRTPMQWSLDRNAGFSRADFAQLYFPLNMDPVYGYQSVNVEAQHRHSTSLLHWMRQMIMMRKKHHVFGRGSLEFLHPENRKVLAFTRSYEGETVLCIYNLARSSQPVLLDLSRYEGMTPMDLQYQEPFPRIEARPYQLALNEYGFYWLLLKN